MKKKRLYEFPKWYLLVRCLLTFAAGGAAGLAAGAVSGADAAETARTGIAAGAALMLAAGYIGGLLRILKSDL